MIYGFIGGMSSGKTLAMTHYAYKDYKKGNHIISNYDLGFKYEILTQEKIKQYAKQEEELEKSTILLDEIYLYIDSRLSASKSNRIYSYFALQTSKRNVNLFYSSQNFHAVDKRIRDNTHVICQVRPVIIRQGKIFGISNQENRLIEKKYWETFYILVTEVRRKSLGFKTKVDTKSKLIKAKDVFKLYDTKQIINFNKGK